MRNHSEVSTRTYEWGLPGRSCIKPRQSIRDIALIRRFPWSERIALIGIFRKRLRSMTRHIQPRGIASCLVILLATGHCVELAILTEYVFW